MKIEKIKIEELNPAKYNPRKDLKKGDPEYEKLKASIEEFDYIEPIVWNKTTGNVVGGHQRLKILKNKGLQEIDVVVVEFDEKKEKMANIALNKISGDWEFTLLADLLEELNTGEFDLGITGFDEKELEKIANFTMSNTDLSDQLKNDFEIVIECKDEIEQKTIYEKMTTEGYKCRILAF